MASPDDSSPGTLAAEAQNQQQQIITDVSNNTFLIDVSTTLPSISTINDFLAVPNCGAISLFLGITRNNFDNKIVTHLSYEGYTPMAIKELTSLAKEAKAKYTSVEKIVAVHLLGDCPVGETSVIVGCASHHRRDAIQCTEFLIDELKGRVPIWKKEIYENDDGSSGGVWKENVEWKEGRRRRVMIKENEEDEEK